MDFTITVTDGNQLTALSRAVAATTGTPTEVEYLQGVVSNFLQGLEARYLVTNLSVFDFLSRFTAAERVAIRTAAQTNATVADYMGMLAAAPGVTLTDSITISDTQALETAGLIATGRAAQILAV